MSDLHTVAPAATSNPGGRIGLADIHLEFVSHRDNLIFFALTLALAGGLLVTGPLPADLLWLGLGWLVFVPQEYWTHVLVLHAPMPRSQRVYTWLYRLHYGHHDHPRRHDLMYMPLWLTLPMLLINAALFWAITPDPRAFSGAFCGALVGYLVFEWSHLLCHVPYVPRSAVWRRARTLHMLHHFADEKRGYAVAPWSLFMDRVLGTQPGHGVKSPSSRFLGLHADHPWVAYARQQFANRSSGDHTCSRLWLRAASRG